MLSQQQEEQQTNKQQHQQARTTVASPTVWVRVNKFWLHRAWLMINGDKAMWRSSRKY